MSHMEIKPPPPRKGCVHLEWKNLALTPEDMPEMEPYCKQLKQFFPRKYKEKGQSMCGQCIFYAPIK